MRVEVLLSTWNGERWLGAQLDSVLAQTHDDLLVTVRDDGSTDGTRQVLEEYAAQDQRVRWSAGKNVGASASFLHLIAASDCSVEAVAFCDQDDVWEPDHLARAVAVLETAGTRSPLLWCSDVLVCDEDLTPLHRHDLVRRGPSFSNALVENIATGCTIVLNLEAVNLLRERPHRVVMHDAWCYLVVSGLGRIHYDPVPSVRYRLHTSNTMGLARGWLPVARARLGRAAAGVHVGAWSRQAEEFRRLHAEQLAPTARRELDNFLSGRRSLSSRARYAITGHAHRQTRLGTLACRLLYAAGRL